MPYLRIFVRPATISKWSNFERLLRCPSSTDSVTTSMLRVLTRHVRGGPMPSLPVLLPPCSLLRSSGVVVCIQVWVSTGACPYGKGCVQCCCRFDMGSLWFKALHAMQ